MTAVKTLGTLNEKKSLVYFASGLRLNGADTVLDPNGQKVAFWSSPVMVVQICKAD